MRTNLKTGTLGSVRVGLALVSINIALKNERRPYGNSWVLCPTLAKPSLQSLPDIFEVFRQMFQPARFNLETASLLKLSWWTFTIFKTKIMELD